MQSASLSTIKNELQHIPQEALVELCIRMAKYKKENKELLNYLLFENTNEHEYIQTLKNEITTEFESVNVSTMFFAKAPPSAFFPVFCQEKYTQNFTDGQQIRKIFRIGRNGNCGADSFSKRNESIKNRLY